MSRIALSVLSQDTRRPRKGKPADYVPLLPREKLKAMTQRVLAAHTLTEAARILRQYAKRLPTGTGRWGWYMRKLARGLLRGRPTLSVFRLDGNVKLPFVAFSTLPQYTCPGAGDCLSWCYSFRAWKNPGAWARQVQNTLLLWHRKDIVRDSFRVLPQGITLRLYVDGDFDSYATVNFWMALLEERPDINAYGYSKSWRLLYDYAMRHSVPANYMLNLSSGHREQGITLQDMLRLPFVRGQFLSVPIDYRPEGVAGNIGFKRYSDPEYHRKVRESAERMGLGRVFSCPGKCGECASGHHACGNAKFRGMTIAIGIH